MQTIPADISTKSGQYSYPIYVGRNILNKHHLILPHLAQKKVAIVTNTTVAPLYLDRLIATLKTNEVNSIPIILPDGEEYKNWQTLFSVYHAAIGAVWQSDEI